MRISNKAYLDFLRALADTVQRAQRESDATTLHLAEKERKIRELVLKVRRLAAETVAMVDLKKQLATRDAQIALWRDAL